MTAASEPSLCPRCAELEGDCACWQDEQDAWDPRLLDAFARHQPPLDLTTLNTLTELGDSGWLIEVIEPDRRSGLRVNLDEATGEIYPVPGHIEWAYETTAMVQDAPAELIPWPECAPETDLPALTRTQDDDPRLDATLP